MKVALAGDIQRNMSQPVNKANNGNVGEHNKGILVCRIGTLNSADNPPAIKHMPVQRYARSPSSFTKTNDCSKPSKLANAPPIKNAPIQMLKMVATDSTKAGKIPKNPPTVEYSIHCLRIAFSSGVNRMTACPHPKIKPINAPDKNAPNPPVSQTNNAVSIPASDPLITVAMTQRNNQ